MICKKCGGTIHGEECKLCELFATGLAYDGVEKERANNPKYSDALGCHPKQVKMMTEELRKRGVPTDFLPNGQCVVTSRNHQKKILKALRMVNKDGSYGD